jgi:predicted DNA-binding antitoxin AbrB/MazE fold protein
MLQDFNAIYENGVLRPLEPLALSEHQQVRVSLHSASTEAGDKAAAQRRAMDELDAALSAIVDRSPTDELNAADHDQILYGKPE